MGEQELVGLVCSDAELIEYFVQLISSIRRFSLKAIWCPDAERSIQLAADNDVPSISHTAYQLISRIDTQTVIIVGHPGHNAVFCIQAQASKKKVICIGALALSVETALLLCDFTVRYGGPQPKIVYPLRYSTPFALLRANISQIGTIHNVSVECNFEVHVAEKERLTLDAKTVLHKLGHELIDAISSVCRHSPRRIAVTHREQSSVVNHFRLRELLSAHVQVAFGAIVASFRIVASNADSLLVRIRGENGVLQLDARVLILERYEGRSVLWQGDGTTDSIRREGTANLLQSEISSDAPSELSLVQCLV